MVPPAQPAPGVTVPDHAGAGRVRRDDQYHGNMTRFREHVWYHLRDLPLMVWRDASVQHFDTVSGDYVWPPRSNSCVPFRQVHNDRMKTIILIHIHIYTCLHIYIWVRLPCLHAQPATAAVAGPLRGVPPLQRFISTRPSAPWSCMPRARQHPAEVHHAADAGSDREVTGLSMRCAGGSGRHQPAADLGSRPAGEPPRLDTCVLMPRLLLGYTCSVPLTASGIPPHRPAGASCPGMSGMHAGSHQYIHYCVTLRFVIAPVVRLQATVEGGWRNKLAYLGLADLQMPIIHTWNVSLNMWNYHVNYRCCSPPHDALQPCAHAPHPGAEQGCRPREQQELPAGSNTSWIADHRVGRLGTVRNLEGLCTNGLEKTYVSRHGVLQLSPRDWR